MRKEVDPVDDETWRTDTAERPAVVATPQPSRQQPPRQQPPRQQPPRQQPPRQQPSQPMPGSPPRPPTGRPDAPEPPRERTPLPGWIAWLIVGLLLAAAAVVGAQLVLQAPGTSTAVDRSTATEEEAPPDDDNAASEPSDAEPSEAEPSEAEPSAEEPAPESVPLTGMAQVTVPAAAPPNNDVTGELVTFAGTNMLDGKDQTAWRMAGDATGRTITFTFDQPVTITSIGILNGYAKMSSDAGGQLFDWYGGNRRVRSVEWVVGDQVVPVNYGEAMQVQFIDVAPTETTTVELRLVAVTPPGFGPSSRNYTAISEVAFNGYPS